MVLGPPESGLMDRGGLERVCKGRITSSLVPKELSPPDVELCLKHRTVDWCPGVGWRVSLHIVTLERASTVPKSKAEGFKGCKAQ
jgi:hypothetical protein